MSYTTEESLAVLLAAYAAERSIANRNAVVESCLYLVHAIAKRIKAAMPKADFDDAVSAGSIGLIEAVERFDPSRGTLFRSYAGVRIRGAMIDHVRDVDPYPRHTRSRCRAWHLAADRLAASLGRRPDDVDIERDLGLRPGQWRHDVALGDRLSVSIDAMQARGDRFMDRADFADGSDTVGNEIESADEFRRLIATGCLYAEEREALRLYYGEGRTQGQVAEALGRTPSCVALKLASARQKISESLAAAA